MIKNYKCRKKSDRTKGSEGEWEWLKNWCGLNLSVYVYVLMLAFDLKVDSSTSANRHNLSVKVCVCHVDSLSHIIHNCVPWNIMVYIHMFSLPVLSFHEQITASFISLCFLPKKKKNKIKKMVFSYKVFTKYAYFFPSKFANR